MLKYILTLILIAGAVVYGISLLLGVGFDSLWNIIGVKEREDRRVAQLAVYSGESVGESHQKMTDNSWPVLLSSGNYRPKIKEVDLPKNGVLLNMPVIDLYRVKGFPIYSIKSNGYSYLTYSDIKYVIRDGIVVGWSNL